MASTCLTFLFVVHLAVIVFGIQQEITFYTEPDQGGESVTFRSSIPDLSDYSVITNNTKSYCATGVWFTFNMKDYEVPVFGFGTFEEETKCSSYTRSIGSSIRHLGASDTLTQALSLYEGSDFAGREHFITSESDNNFPFNPVRYVSSGRTVWTLFEGPNFNGISKCTELGDYNLYHGYISPLQTVGSVVKGCGAEVQRNIVNYKLGVPGVAKNL